VDTAGAVRDLPNSAAAHSVGYRFAHFELQLDERRLLATGAPVEIGPRAFDLLVAMVERGGHLVTKSELLERVWPKLIVEEGNLHVQVWALRKILGSDAIETIPGHGYRFTLGVTSFGAESPSGTPKPQSKNNLPHQLTSFIGRETEIAEIRTLLGRARLLTLTGSGGCGKTRLAIQIGARLSNIYPDGVWIIELVSVSDPGLVPQALAMALGLKGQPGRSLTQSVIEHLANKHLVLVLDNAEHMLATCAQITEAVLRQCPQVVIIATSRERLATAGEQTYRVPGMSMPDSDRDATAASLAQCESALLFVDRARLNAPHFVITNENAPALASICRRLDGIPLAIELAAARTRSMSVAEVSRRLDQQFRLLTGGSPAAPRRQQTLRGLIDWSYDLLSDTEKTMFQRVSVFSGSWSPEAAEQVCVGEGIEDWRVLDLLTSLADKNLVVAEVQRGATRYRLLETIHQYARERLNEGSEDARWHGRHLAYFLALAEAEPRNAEADQDAWLDILEIEHGNMRAALAWSAATEGYAEPGLRLAVALWWYWLVRGHLGEGRDWLSRLLAAGPRGQTSPTRANALTGAGELARHQGDYAAARTLHEEGLALQRELGDRRGVATSLINLGGVAYDQGDYAAARALLQESLAAFRELGDPRGIATSLHNLGELASKQGDDSVAQALYEESLAMWRDQGDRWGIATSLTCLGKVSFERGDHPAARALAEESLAIQRELGDRPGIATSLCDLGRVAREQKDLLGARRLLNESLTIRWELGDRPGIADSLEGLACVASAAGGPGRAARIWGMAERLRDEIGSALPPRERPRHALWVATARADLGDGTAFDYAWQQGRAMTLDRAVEYSIKDERS
jgi:non-specific serine/threonine protein kinase